MKLLHWERGGYVIYYKRMEVGRISRKVFQAHEIPVFYELRWDVLVLFMEGVYAPASSRKRINIQQVRMVFVNLSLLADVMIFSNLCTCKTNSTTMTSKQYIKHLTAAEKGIRGKDVPHKSCARVIDGLCGVIADKDTLIASKDELIAKLSQQVRLFQRQTYGGTRNHYDIIWISAPG